MVKHILITGASGLIGTRLTEMLLAKGYSVAHLGRSKKEDGVKSFVWNVDKQVIQPGALKGITAVIHLAGAGVAEKRWTKDRKQEILESRAKSTALLYDELKKGHHNVTTFISASAIGYYGFENDTKIFHEDDEPGKDFLAQVTRQWEDEVNKINNLGIRVVKIRVGVVLSEKGGALKEMSTPIRMYAGSPLGTGKQMMSWIHLDDLCSIFIKMIEDEQHSGAFNAVAPHPVS
ncbi:MAG TPA: TIGR01777 family oxidoreductase, partial [Cyclobacteriaceae bacterium]